MPGHGERQYFGIVAITDEAEADLERIADYIAADNSRRAASFVKELLERCERLIDTPHGFPLISRFEHTGVRRRPYRGYLIFYHVDPEAIKILRILNGTQDCEPILFPES